MYESVELARILDVSEILLKTTCCQNSAITSLSIMAKIHLPEKLEPKTTLLHSEHIYEKRSSSTPSPAMKIFPSSESLNSPYSSSTDAKKSIDYVEDKDKSLNDLEEMIREVQSMQIVKSFNIKNNFDDSVITVFEYENKPTDENSNFVYKQNIDVPKNESTVKSGEQEKVKKEEAQSRVGLCKRGPVRPQLHPIGRVRPYIEGSHHWVNSVIPQSDLPMDYDTSAKAILTDREYREKIDFCLDKLSDMSQERSMTNSLSPGDSDFGGASCYSPPQQQWQSDSSPTAPRSGNIPSSSCFVPSITVSDSESSLMAIISRGGFQLAHSKLECNSGASVAPSSNAYASDNGPDSPASSYNNCATSVSRPNSRGSSPAQSPGSNNGCNGATFLNVFGSPVGSPLLSTQNFRSHPRPSSSSSSSQSYCDTPSPTNYQNPLDQNLEEQLGQHMTSTLPVSRNNLEASETTSDSDLQLVEELIRGEMNESKHQIQSSQYQNHLASDIQVVPNCSTASPSNMSQNYSINTGEHTKRSQFDSTVDQITGTELELTRHLLPKNRYNSTCEQQAGTRFVSMKPNMSRTGYSCTSDQMAGSGFDQTGSIITSSLDVSDTTDHLTNTLLRFVGSEQTAASHRKVEARCSPTNTNSRSNNNETRESRNMDYLQMEQSTNNSSTVSISSASQQPQPQQQQSIYQQQCMSLNMENHQFPPISVSMGENTSWGNYPESTMTGISTSNTQYNLPLSRPVTTCNIQPSTNMDKRCSPKTLRRRSRIIGMREIAPLPYLTLPSTSASERLKAAVGTQGLQRSMSTLLKRSNEELTRPDADGYTSLMCLVCNPEELKAKLSFLAPLVERLGTIQDALILQNNNKQDALYLAAMKNPQMAFVTGYLAAALIKNNIDIGQRLYGMGDTLIHKVVSRGDTYGEILAELLSLKTAQGNAVFDLTKRNYEGRTALHVAALTHTIDIGKEKISTAVSRLLMENGADPTMVLYTSGDTALHSACARSCDPALIKSLLAGRGREALNIGNYAGDTPLHVAANNRENVPVDRQMEACRLLIIQGARTNAVNRHGKTPIALVAPDRKDAFRRMLPKK